MVSHHVFFWLKDPASRDDLGRLLAGLGKLKNAPTAKDVRIGVPATTPARDVVDHSFHASLLIFFDSVDGHNLYQGDPVHLHFVDECESLWSKVVVYDTVEI